MGSQNGFSFTTRELTDIIVSIVLLTEKILFFSGRRRNYNKNPAPESDDAIIVLFI